MRLHRGTLPVHEPFQIGKFNLTTLYVRFDVVYKHSPRRFTMPPTIAASTHEETPARIYDLE